MTIQELLIIGKALKLLKAVLKETENGFRVKTSTRAEIKKLMDSTPKKEGE